MLALQPGVASVYCTIVQQTHNGVELYVRQFPDMVGMQFGDIRRRFESAIVVGFMAKAGELRMNPPDEEEMPEGARLIALADDGADPCNPAAIAVKAKGRCTPAASLALRRKASCGLAQTPQTKFLLIWSCNS